MSLPGIRLAVPLLSIIALLPACALPGDPVAGETAALHCRSCHGVHDGDMGIGPSLFGVVGRKSASLEGYAYSPAMRNADVVWNTRTLDRFLTGSRSMIPGNKMPSISIWDDEFRRNIIAYLTTLK